MRRRQPGPYSLCAVIQSPYGLVDVHTVAETVPKCGPFGYGRRYSRLEEIHGFGDSAQNRTSARAAGSGHLVVRRTPSYRRPDMALCLVGLVGLHVTARTFRTSSLRRPSRLLSLTVETSCQELVITLANSLVGSFVTFSHIAPLYACASENPSSL
jgi:hypothetical protein